MPTEILPLITFVLVTTFTPGPNNISSAAMGVLHGYKKTLRYLLGICTGFFGMMLLSAWVSASLLHVFPSLEIILRYVGAAYIIYLAIATLKTSYAFDDEEVKPLGFANGLLLQILNPKLIVYGLTLFSTFLAHITHQPARLLVAAALLMIVSFCATSTWALFGTVIKRYLHQPRIRFGVNAILSLFLVYSALELAGIL
jgi:cysteine/O-acetylserine efflux protein